MSKSSPTILILLLWCLISVIEDSEALVQYYWLLIQRHNSVGIMQNTGEVKEMKRIYKQVIYVLYNNKVIESHSNKAEAIK